MCLFKEDEEEENENDVLFSKDWLIIVGWIKCNLCIKLNFHLDRNFLRQYISTNEKKKGNRDEIHFQEKKIKSAHLAFRTSKTFFMPIFIFEFKIFNISNNSFLTTTTSFSMFIFITVNTTWLTINHRDFWCSRYWLFTCHT